MSEWKLGIYAKAEPRELHRIYPQQQRPDFPVSGNKQKIEEDNETKPPQNNAGKICASGLRKISRRNDD